MRPVINTVKHVTQFSLSNVALGAISPLSIVDVVAAPSNSDEVAEGTKIEAVYVEMWLTSGDAAQSSCIMTLEKRPSGLGAMTAGESAALFTYDNKKNILYTLQGLLPSTVQIPLPAIRKWVKIPKGKQRFGLGDKLVLNIHGQSNDVNLCGFAIYKSQN